MARKTSKSLSAIPEVVASAQEANSANRPQVIANDLAALSEIFPMPVVNLDFSFLASPRLVIFKQAADTLSKAAQDVGLQKKMVAEIAALRQVKVYDLDQNDKEAKEVRKSLHRHEASVKWWREDYLKKVESATFEVDGRTVTFQTIKACWLTNPALEAEQTGQIAANAEAWALANAESDILGKARDVARLVELEAEKEVIIKKADRKIASCLKKGAEALNNIERLKKEAADLLTSAGYIVGNGGVDIDAMMVAA